MYDFILSVSVKTIRFLKIRSCSSFYFAWVLPDITEMKACCWLALMFNSSTEIISTSTAAVLGEMFLFTNLPIGCGFIPVAPGSYSETNIMDHKTWKSCKLLAHLPKQMLNTTGNGNRGLGTVVFSWFVTLLNHDFVSVQATPFFVGLMTLELVVGFLKTGAPVITISDGITSLSAGMVSRLPLWVFRQVRSHSNSASKA